MILERRNQILLGYMSMCRLLFLSDRRDELVRWEQIKVCDLIMCVIIPGTKDGRAAQTMRTSLGIVAENSRVCLLVKVRTLTSTNREHDGPGDYRPIWQERYDFFQIPPHALIK